MCSQAQIVDSNTYVNKHHHVGFSIFSVSLNFPFPPYPASWCRFPDKYYTQVIICCSEIWGTQAKARVFAYLLTYLLYVHM